MVHDESSNTEHQTHEICITIAPIGTCHTHTDYTQYQPLFPVQSTWAPPYLNCSFIACSVQGVSEYSLLRLVPNCRHEWDSGGLRMWQMSPLRILTPGQTHYVCIKLVAHTHAHMHIHTCTHAHCTHTLYLPLRGEEEEESWQFDPLDPGGQTHIPELQVPPLLIQDKEHSACHTKEENSAITWITTQAWSKQTNGWNFLRDSMKKRILQKIFMAKNFYKFSE